MLNIQISEIKIGDQQREDAGDVSSLAESIRDIGLLHPVVITKNKELMAGRRRLEAVKRLGWTEVPARILEVKNDGNNNR